MKIVFVLMMAALALLAGCGDDSKTVEGSYNTTVDNSANNSGNTANTTTDTTDNSVNNSNNPRTTSTTFTNTTTAR